MGRRGENQAEHSRLAAFRPLRELPELTANLPFVAETKLPPGAAVYGDNRPIITVPVRIASGENAA